MADAVRIFFPLPANGRGVSYTCLSIARELGRRGLGVELFAPRADAKLNLPFNVMQTLPGPARYLPFRRIDKIAEHFQNKRFSEAFAEVNACEIAYLFPNPPTALYAALRQANAIVVREMINCHRGMAKRILDAEYERLGLVPRHGISEQSVAEETESLKLAHYVFCPNPMVEASLREHGVEANKVLRASYGWDPNRFPTDFAPVERWNGLTLIFVGAICVRKGAHLIADYWLKSDVAGRLIFVGDLDPVFAARFRDLLDHENITVMSYTRDINALYRSSDVFAFPTLEEGGPLVTFEAAGCGLPVLTTPMGASRIVTSGENGFVLDAHDEGGWIHAIRTLASNRVLRTEMAYNAWRSAAEFTWDKVGERRAAQLKTMLADRHLRSRPHLDRNAFV